MDSTFDESWDEVFDETDILVTEITKSGGSKKSRGSSPKSKKGDKSLIEWFDKTLEDELAVRRGESPIGKLDPHEQGGLGHPNVVGGASRSFVDIQSGVMGQRNTDLYEAANSLAKAEATVAFEGAIRAAEEAAASAPPEMAEEAAVRGAKGFQAELTSVVAQKVPGTHKPIEVIGYVGITRPKYPKKFNP